MEEKDQKKLLYDAKEAKKAAASLGYVALPAT